MPSGRSRRRVVSSPCAGSCPANADALRHVLPSTAPQPLGRRAVTIGLGDRLGKAGAGHIAAIRARRAWPVLAQQSVRELTLTGRTFAEVLDASTWAVFREGFREPWGGDGDHLKTEEWVGTALATGLTMITADVSDALHADRGSRGEGEINAAYEALDGAYRREIEARYLSSAFALQGGGSVRFTPLELRRTVLVYRDAVGLAARLYRAGAAIRGEAGFDFELSIDETENPTTPQAHLFMAMEARRVGVALTSLAPRFVGEFQKGIDYIGTVAEFEESFTVHARIAATLGYRISVHSGSDKFSVFPSVGRLSGGRFHLKTAGTSWLEALRVVAGADPALFRRLYALALERYANARALYHVTPDLAALPGPGSLGDADGPALLQDTNARRVLHITYGEMLAVPELKAALFRVLAAHGDDYARALERHIGRHLSLLGIGSAGGYMTLRGRIPGRPGLWEVGCTGTRIDSIAQTASEAPDTHGRWITPGLFDLQINGIGGINYTSAELTVEQLVRADALIRDHGVSRYCATMITCGLDTACRVIDTFNEAWRRGSIPAAWGLHVEGPWISPEDGFRGVHRRELVRDPSIAELDVLRDRAGKRLRLLTVAPERPGAEELIRHASEAGITVCLGHTNAAPADVSRAVRAGARMSTHLFNGCARMVDRHSEPHLQPAGRGRPVRGFHRRRAPRPVPDAAHRHPGQGPAAVGARQRHRAPLRACPTASTRWKETRSSCATAGSG